MIHIPGNSDDKWWRITQILKRYNDIFFLQGRNSMNPEDKSISTSRRKRESQSLKTTTAAKKIKNVGSSRVPKRL
jgi:hypothetical protein